MRRFLKKYLGHVLPRPIIRWCKNRLETGFDGPARPGRALSLLRQDTAIQCTVDGIWSFLAPPDCEEDLSHFVNTRRGQTEFEALASCAEAGGIFFDIGAHAGITSAIFCAGNPGNLVFSFEPSPKSQDRISALVNLNNFEGRLSLERVAVGEKSGAVEMLIDPIGGFVQTQRFQGSMWGEPLKIQVGVESIADAASRLGVIPTFIKLDIEGYEYEAIRGSKKFLQQHQPQILLELHLNYLEERQLSSRTLVETLLECGYALRSYSGRTLRPQEVYHSVLSNIHLIAQKG